MTNSTINPRDFRVYVHNVRLVDAAGCEVPVQLEQDEKCQLEDVRLLDFEDATGSCGNGTPDRNDMLNWHRAPQRLPRPSACRLKRTTPTSPKCPPR